MTILYYTWVKRIVRRYAFICAHGCYYTAMGTRHTCTDCLVYGRYE